jgi:hypothetical protein
MAFVEDLTPYFADFGDAATLAGAAVRVIFDGPGGVLGGMTIEAPQVQIASSGVPAAYKGATLIISTGRGAGTYKVREHLPDGTGMSLLSLTEVAA